MTECTENVKDFEGSKCYVRQYQQRIGVCLFFWSPF